MIENFFKDTMKTKMGALLMLLAVALILFVGMSFVNQVKTFYAIGEVPVNTIDVTGTGKAFAIPDVATESFTVSQTASTVTAAQTTVTGKANAILAFLKGAGVADKDVQTTDYSAYPNYSSVNPCYGAVDVPCPFDGGSQAQKVIGYTVTESMSVKVESGVDLGSIVAGLTTNGATGLSGPTFTVGDEETVEAEARANAIADAKAKAEVLATELGIRLVRVVNFSENNNGGYAMPMASGAMNSMAAPAPALPQGQNTYTSSVTVTYEIR